MVPGSGRLLDPMPGDTHLHFDFLLFGNESAPHDAVSDIRGFIGNFLSTSLSILDVENEDFVEPPYFPDRSDLPSRRHAPSEIDRDNPMPSWFEQGFEISRTNDPLEPVTIGLYTTMAQRYHMAVPEAAFPGRQSIALLRVPFADRAIDLTLIQMAVLTKPRRHRWYRAPFKIGVVSRVEIADMAPPFILHETPLAEPAMVSQNSPVTFTGVVGEFLQDGFGASGLAGVYLRIQDSRDGTGKEFDFETSLWRSVRTEPHHSFYAPSYKKMDLTDVGNGRWRYLYQWDGGLTGNWYYWEITAVDNRGNERRFNYSLNIDVRPPRLTLIQPSFGRGIVGATAAITFRVDDDLPLPRAGLSIRHVETGNYWDDVTNSWVSTPNTFAIVIRVEETSILGSYEWTPALDQATFEVTVTQRDLARNETVLVEMIHYENLDQTAPEIVIVAPRNGGRYPLGRFTVIGRVKDNLAIDPQSAVLEIYQISDDGSEGIISAQSIELHPNASGWLSFGINQDLRDAPGNYRYVIGVSDSYGNQSAQEVLVNVGT